MSWPVIQSSVELNISVLNLNGHTQFSGIRRTNLQIFSADFGTRYQCLKLRASASGLD